MNRYEDDCSQGNSWISIRSLINESKINSIYSKHDSDSSLDSSSCSPRQESSITMEWKPNTYINQSVCFSSMHDNYCKDMQDLSLNLTPEGESPTYEKNIEAMKYYIHRRDSKFRKLQKTYNRDVMQLKEEVSALQSKLSQRNDEVEKLTELFDKIQEDHTLQLQNMQARHERKLQRSKMDLDSLLSDINEKTAVYVTEKMKVEHQEEIEALRDFYEEKIEELRVEHELELNSREFGEGKENFKEELEKERERQREVIEGIEMKYGKEISNLKRLLTIQREENKCLKTVESYDEVEMKKLVKRMEEEIESLKETIDSYGRTIDELSKELQGTFRKKKKNTQEGLEGDLHMLLGQINTFLDSSELTSSKDLGETIKSLQSKIELLASGKISL